MDELQFLNVFNYCFVSPTYLSFDIENNRYDFRLRNVCWNVTLLVVLVTVNCIGATVMVLEFMQDQLDSVMGACNIIICIMRLSVVIPLILWIWLYRHKVLEVCTIALNLLQDKSKLVYQTSSKLNSRCLLYWMQVGTVLILLIAAMVGDVYIWWKFIAKQKLYYILNLSAYIILDFVSLMHLMYTQCLALVIADHFHELACRIKNEPNEPDLLQTVNTTWDDLEHYKQRIIATFGVMIVLHALDALVKCAVETYVIFSTWEMGFGLLGAFLDIITLTVYAVTFFIFAFAHDRVEVKEAELKDALKSMQYTNLKRQSRDQKDFYDLVNLKLMMESPKITACGLFEINLQIFYNVFAAIITYIVILFQFRGFEKSP
ncbi:AGAP006143-PB [Anopheles gambiae str. PEST]|uniref:Gustatory receptor n=1 Tax=Anopheles gambiae TaxID=7165 RepID=A7UU26_ANOGA|nr:AGAP006143-PB [Anopheles gambiae str. PEST]